MNIIVGIDAACGWQRQWIVVFIITYSPPPTTLQPQATGGVGGGGGDDDTACGCSVVGGVEEGLELLLVVGSVYCGWHGVSG